MAHSHAIHMASGGMIKNIPRVTLTRLAMTVKYPVDLCHNSGPNNSDSSTSCHLSCVDN